METWKAQLSWMDKVSNDKVLWRKLEEDRCIMHTISEIMQL